MGRRLIREGLFCAFVVLACCGSPNSAMPDGSAGADGSIAIDSRLPDASSPQSDASLPPDAAIWCPTLEDSCWLGNLRDCVEIGQPPVSTSCVSGCVETPTAHCGTIVPTGVITV